MNGYSHHAYPEELGVVAAEKNWYLTGSFNALTKELKIVFYDQGIGIPKSLHASEIGEKVLKLIAEKFSIAESKQHAVMIRAAVELARSRTGESDRGKGLQDLLEFVKKREGGYLSIISLKGLYKYTQNVGKFTIKSEGLRRPLKGTLIIWSVNLG